MQIIDDLRFGASLYKHLNKKHQRLIKGLSGSMVLLLVALAGMVSMGVLTTQNTSAALDAHESVVPKRSEPPLPFIPSPPATVWPTPGKLTTGFGSRTPAQRHHSGIDIGGKYGDPVLAFRAGKVTVAEKRSANSTGLGRYVMIDHGNGLASVYGHLSSVNVQVGQNVTTQTVIGKQGSTGEAYGVHLHFEVRLNGRQVNPMPYMAGLPLPS